MLIGVRTSEGCALLENSTTALSRVDAWACIGYGAPLGSYLASTLFDAGGTTKAARFLAAYLLKQTKKYTPFCGGDSHIVTLPRTGEHVFNTEEDSQDDEEYLSILSDALKPVAFAGSDLEVSDEAFQQGLREFTERAKGLRNLTDLGHFAGGKIPHFSEFLAFCLDPAGPRGKCSVTSSVR